MLIGTVRVGIEASRCRGDDDGGCLNEGGSLVVREAAQQLMRLVWRDLVGLGEHSRGHGDGVGAESVWAREHHHHRSPNRRSPWRFQGRARGARRPLTLDQDGKLPTQHESPRGSGLAAQCAFALGHK